ncbi:MAG: hypothetical protein ACE366_01715 [Bradymonadia bacterium]
MRIAYFTATMGGAGHLARGVALGNGLRRQGFTGDYRMFGPPMPYATGLRDDYTALTLTRESARSPAAIAASPLAEALQAFDPDLLLVDHFWVSIHHLLPQLRCEAWLLLHTVPRPWLAGPPMLRFDRRRFAQVIAIEPMEHHTLDDMVPPVVIVNPDECHPPSKLRDLFSVPADRTLTLLAHTGLGEGREVADLEAEFGVGPHEMLVSLSMHRGEAIFPLAPYLPGADRLIGGGGYNFFWETQWLGLGDRTLYRPFHRTLDNQKWRVEHLQGMQMSENGADVLARQMMAG